MSIIPIPLTGQQKALYEALVKESSALADIFLGALLTLSAINNPERFAQAAHSLRELLEKIPKHLNLPVKSVVGPSLTTLVQDLEREWDKASSKSKCGERNSWSGEVDGPLSTFLKKAHEFFALFKQHIPKRKASITKTLRALDSVGLPLPEPIEDLRVDEWEEIHNYFVKVAHHSRSTDEFGAYLDALERFLLDRFVPRTFVDHEAIDKLIAEG